jgi:hypothetical protein
VPPLPLDKSGHGKLYCASIVGTESPSSSIPGATDLVLLKERKGKGDRRMSSPAACFFLFR